MKTTLAISLFVFPTLSLAYPSIGTIAEYEGKVEKGKGKSEQPLKLSRQIVDLDKESKTWIIENTRTVSGKAKASLEEIAMRELSSPAKLQELIFRCTNATGEVQTITVPAGTFKTCHLKKSDPESAEELWIADVPFGIVKKVEKDFINNTTENYELKSINRR